MPDTSKATSAASGTTAAHSATQQQTQSAIDLVDRLQDFVGGLKRELRAYGDPDTAGRDTAKLANYFRDIHDCELGIARFMGVQWSPGQT